MTKKIFFILFTVLAFSCSTNTESLTSDEFSRVQDSVRMMLTSVSQNVSQNGPVAWLGYFENEPSFYMASQGELVFPNHDSAKVFIDSVLVKIMPKIKLQWSNISIDPISPNWADARAYYHEEIRDPSGKTNPENGYFTALVHRRKEGWKLRNAHWSTRAAH
ncbi:MAG TPA: hypothetical protein VNV85_13265 [Puia sp.]|jgi:hypothetical protein|nr:hypothetical protein [Puia sp.]